ncbi:ferric iron reductase protein FhuF [Melghirimyces profundicolus]|uniref:Ferric iron reductase protein FhuF n=1 Tax=Melghirimyces profundicolus TaxID=1242148 RepID=A0A2T6BXH7_9BACL|nr:(2Fe-2S)-binding protein [Melghirimyces profundicolus]PTX60763.1 ferric iron reductase protein FhuF [Melghirimyces profundicolus]
MAIHTLNQEKTAENPVPSVPDLPVRSLLQPDLRDSLLRAWGDKISADHSAVAASMLAKRYLSVLLAEGLYAITRRNECPDYSLGNLRLRFGKGWDLTLSLGVDQRSRPPSGDRDVWRKEAFRHLFRENVTPVLTSLSAHISPAILWESARGYVTHHYEKWLAETEAPGEREQIRSDHSFLTEERNHRISGSLPNPLSLPFRLSPDPENPGRELRFRRTCCLYHRLPGARPCPTCPGICAPGNPKKSK